MFSMRFGTSVIVLLAAISSAHAQGDKIDPEVIARKKTQDLLDKATEEYRVFFQRPENTIEFWSAIKFEMDLGKFDLAALHMKLLLAKEPPEDVDKDLVKIEAADGMSKFLRLRLVKQWSDYAPFQKEAVENVEKLIDRVTNAVEKHLSDPTRIKKYIAQLDAATPEERAYAFVEIARSRERAVPYLIEALRVNFGKSISSRIKETLLRVGPETVPVYLEVFKAANDKDYRDHELRLTLLDVVRQRDDDRVVPYLWHMYDSKKYPDAVRKKAKETLASLLKVSVIDVPPAKESLTALAERYYQHKVRLADGKAVKIWPWNGESIALKPTELPAYQAEEFFGTRYAREALDLDASYQPAQVVLLSLMLERYYKPELDQVLLKPMPPKMHQLLTTIDANLLMRVLARAMEDKQLAVIIPAIQALGERSETRAAQPHASGRPGGVTAGLYYPDRRVQFASLKAMLKMPQTASPSVASDRMVDLAKRFLASETTPKALVVYTPAGDEAKVRQVVKDLGYEAVLAKNTKEALDKGRATADYELLILNRGLADNELASAYSQLHNQYDLGALPMVIVVAKGRESAVQKYVGNDPGVLVLGENRFAPGDDWKNQVETLVKNVQVAKLSAAERKEFSKVSMDTLWRMARGDITGYNVMPALDVILDQIRNPDYAVEALEILGRLPGKDVQYRLANIVNNNATDAKLRIPAAIELNRHIHKNGVLLDKRQQADLKQAFAAAAEGTPLRTQLTITMSTLVRPSAAVTGADLFQFRPDVAAPPKEKEDEKKDKDAK